MTARGARFAIRSTKICSILTLPGRPVVLEALTPVRVRFSNRSTRAESSVMLNGFVAASGESAVRLTWSVSVVDWGFILERRVFGQDPAWQRVHKGVIPATISADGREFVFTDAGVLVGTEYEYRLSSVGENNDLTQQSDACNLHPHYH